MNPGTALLLMCLWAPNANARVHGPAAGGTPASLQRSSATVTLASARSPAGPRVLHVDAFGQRHTLRLRPAAAPFADTFRLQTTARDKEGRLIFKDVPQNEEHDAGELYQDPESGGVVRVRGARVEGAISPTLTLAAGADGRHEAVRREIQPDHDVEDYLEVLLEERPHPGSSAPPRAVSSATVEMYIIVDSVLAATLGTDQEVKDFLGVFWNAVNLRFTTISDPKINLVLAGALIVRDAADEPYITSNTAEETYLDTDKALAALGVWVLQQKSKLPAHDMAYLMTGMDMYKGLNSGILGVAYVGMACRASSYMAYNVAISEAYGDYTGVLTAAHEVGHNLGAQHDSKSGPEECLWSLGYIMSYLTVDANKLFFSPCSKTAMKNYISTREAACLQTTETGSKIPLSTTLPGQLLSLDQQCQEITSRSNAKAARSVPDDFHCFNLVCEWKPDGGKYSFKYRIPMRRPAAEGSPCRKGGACKNGSCQ